MEQKEGIFTNINIIDYHKDKTFISSSGLKHAKRSLKEFKLYEEGYFDCERKSYFDFGNAFELALLDKESFLKEVTIFDESERPEPDKTFASTKNKEWKEYQYTNSNYIINAKGDESFETITEMLKSCYADAVINKIIKNIEYQTSIYWTCETSGLKLKTRPDIIKKEKRIIIDVKTAIDGSPKGFSKALTNNDYPFQASMQIDGILQSGYMDRVDNYFWLVVEKKPPFSATLYEFMPEDQGFCKAEYEYVKKLVSMAREENLYPSYTQRADNKYGILQAEIPLYYKTI